MEQQQTQQTQHTNETKRPGELEVLCHIFRKMFIDKENKNIQQTLF